MKIVVVDIDGVLQDFIWGFSKIASTMFLTEQYSSGQQMEWREKHWSQAEKELIWEKVDADERFWIFLPALILPQEKQIFERVIRANNLVPVYLTNRRESTREQTAEWLFEWQNMPDGPVVHVDNRATTKVEALRLFAAGAPVIGIIEDSPSNIRDYRDSEFRDVLTVRDWPFNRDFPASVRRVSSFAEWCGIIKEAAK